MGKLRNIELKASPKWLMLMRCCNLSSLSFRRVASDDPGLSRIRCQIEGEGESFDCKISGIRTLLSGVPPTWL